MKKYQVGIDLGGTNVRAALIDSDLHIVRKQAAKTPKNQAEAVVQTIAGLVHALISEEALTIGDVASIGIAAPGTVHNDAGKVLYANNLGWDDVSLRDMVQKDFRVPVYLENDANAAALGESWFGANKGLSHSIMITLGTGVGTGVIIDGKMLTGSNYAGGELGHMVIVAGGAQCTCGRKGCWEAYSSATALMRMARQAAMSDPASRLWEVCDRQLEHLSAEHVFELASERDVAALEVIDRYMQLLKIAIVNLVCIFQPEQIALGGGISNQGERLLIPLQQAVDAESYGSRHILVPRIVCSELDGDAGLLGAALLGRYHEGGIL